MLYIHKTREPARQTPPPKTAAAGLPDPWHTPEPEESGDGSNWLLSYADVITLLFALFVLLCAHQKIMLDQTARLEPAANPVVVAASEAPKDQARQPALPPAAEIPAQPAHTAQSDMTLSAQPKEGGVMVQTAVAAAQAEEPHWLGMPEPASRPALSPPTPLNGKMSEADWNRWVEFSATDEKVRLEVNDNILFDPASARLKPEGLQILDSLASWLKHQTGRIDVEGHTDNSPIKTLKFGSNWELSSARASAVTRYLISLGLGPERIKAIGLADTQPRIGNETPDGRARNRRVSLVLYLPIKGGMNI